MCVCLCLTSVFSPPPNWLKQMVALSESGSGALSSLLKGIIFPSLFSSTAPAQEEPGTESDAREEEIWLP